MEDKHNPAFLHHPQPAFLFAVAQTLSFSRAYQTYKLYDYWSRPTQAKITGQFGRVLTVGELQHFFASAPSCSFCPVTSPATFCCCKHSTSTAPKLALDGQLQLPAGTPLPPSRAPFPLHSGPPLELPLLMDTPVAMATPSGHPSQPCPASSGNECIHAVPICKSRSQASHQAPAVQGFGNIRRLCMPRFFGHVCAVPAVGQHRMGPCVCLQIPGQLRQAVSLPLPRPSPLPLPRPSPLPLARLRCQHPAGHLVPDRLSEHHGILGHGRVSASERHGSERWGGWRSSVAV